MIPVSPSRSQTAPLHIGRIHPLAAFVIGLSCLSLTGCVNRIMMPTQDWLQPANQAEQQPPVLGLLPVDDAIATVEQRNDPAALGEDLSHYGILGVLPIRYEFNQYQADRSRSEVVQDGLIAGLTKAGLPTMAGSEQTLRSLPEGRLLVQATVRSFQLTSENDFSTLIFVTAGHLKKLIAQVALDCQVIKPGQATPIWQGTVEGTAVWDAGQYGDADWAQNTRWLNERGTVLREALNNVAVNLVTQSGLRTLSARMLTESNGSMIAKMTERETAGDLPGALQLATQAYRNAPTADQAKSAIAAIARIVSKMPVPPALPEEARKYGVQASSLTQQKRYDEGTTLYDKGLAIAPWWADGHFNRALLLAEQHRFAEAIPAMQRFLILTPNAPDARAAQDKIYEWELGTTSQPASSNGTSSTPMKDGNQGKGTTSASTGTTKY